MDRLFVNVQCLAQMCNQVMNPSDMGIFSKWGCSDITVAETSHLLNSAVTRKLHGQTDTHCLE